MRKIWCDIWIPRHKKLWKKMLWQISCSYFRGSKFQFSNKFQNRKYASIELENHFQSVKSWFSVVLNVGATISLRDEMIWRKIPLNSPLYLKGVVPSIFPWASVDTREDRTWSLCLFPLPRTEGKIHWDASLLCKVGLSLQMTAIGLYTKHDNIQAGMKGQPG